MGRAHTSSIRAAAGAVPALSGPQSRWLPVTTGTWCSSRATVLGLFIAPHEALGPDLLATCRRICTTGRTRSTGRRRRSRPGAGGGRRPGSSLRLFLRALAGGDFVAVVILAMRQWLPSIVRLMLALPLKITSFPTTHPCLRSFAKSRLFSTVHGVTPRSPW